MHDGVMQEEKKTCKDCVYYEVCADFRRNICNTDKKRFEEYCVNTDGLCNSFKDKLRFVELPCKVGDTVWIIGEIRGIYCATVRVFFLNETGVEMMRTTECDIPFSQFGKTVFLTREKAEKALAEREGKG